MAEQTEAIRRRWSTDYDRGARDYTDAGCRVLAEHAFRDVNALLPLAERAEQAEAEVAGLRASLQLIDSLLTTAEGDNIPRGETVKTHVRYIVREALAHPQGAGGGGGE